MARTTFHETFTYGNYINCSNTYISGKQRYPQWWTPPLPEWIKYNTDAAKNRKTNYTAISYICRSATNMNTAKFATSFGDLNILSAEVLAIRQAVIHAKAKNYPKVIIGSDSLTAIQALNEATNPLFFIAPLVEDIKNLAADFENISFCFCLRSINQDADKIAKYASKHCKSCRGS